jgi:hypothetical protein
MGEAVGSAPTFIHPAYLFSFSVGDPGGIQMLREVCHKSHKTLLHFPWDQVPCVTRKTVSPGIDLRPQEFFRAYRLPVSRGAACVAAACALGAVLSATGGS